MDRENSDDLTQYRITLNMVGDELIRIWVEAVSRTDAIQNVKYNIRPRATVQHVESNIELPPGVTVHTINKDGTISNRRVQEANA